MTETGGARGAPDEIAAEPGAPMAGRAWGTLLGGAIMIAFGIWFGVRTSEMTIGTATNMGPGYFPMVLSVLSGIIGAVLLLQGLRSTAPRIDVDWRPMVFVSLSVLAFAAGIAWFGLVPAVVATIVVASLADPDVRLLPTLLLAAGMSVFSWLIFTVGLGLALPPFAWGF